MADKKKKYYAVIKGRRPGIYTEWFGETGAHVQVNGFQGAVYKGFETRNEAEQFLRTGKSTPVAPSPSLFSKVDSPARLSVTEQPLAAVDSTVLASYASDLSAGKVVIFTDGASTGNPGPGGYGVVMLSGDQHTELSGGFRCTTNNRMEMMGVITALQSLTHRSQVVLYTDSRYVVNSVQLGWAKRWRARGWMRTTADRAENADLWAQLLDLLDQHAVEFRWVKGHANNPQNERCDRLAVQAAHKQNLPTDAGFQGRC